MNCVGLIGWRAAAAALGLCLLPLIGGCGCSGSNEVAVSGIVTHKGLPVPDLIVFFGAGDQRAYWGTTDLEGIFHLQGERGRQTIPRGTYTVWVNYDPIPSDPIAMLTDPTTHKDPPGLKEILAKYGKREKSPLQLEITKAEKELPIELD